MGVGGVAEAHTQDMMHQQVPTSASKTRVNLLKSTMPGVPEGRWRGERLLRMRPSPCLAAGHQALNRERQLGSRRKFTLTPVCISPNTFREAPPSLVSAHGVVYLVLPKRL